MSAVGRLRRTPAAGSLTVALGLLAVCLVVIAGVEIAASIDPTAVDPASIDPAAVEPGPVDPASVDPGDGEPWWSTFAPQFAAFVFAAMGLLAWTRRPANRTGAIMVVGAVALLSIALGEIPVAALGAVASVAATLVLAVLVHLLLAFPSGSVRSAAARRTVVAGYAVCLVLQAPLYLFNPARSPHGMLAVADRPGIAELAQWVQSAAGIAVMVATAVICAVRFGRARPRARRVLAPLYLYGILAAMAVPLIPLVVVPLTGISYATSGVLQLILIALVPITIGACMLLGGFARTGEVQELAAYLGAEAVGRGSIREALARALGDPTVRLAFWAPHLARFVDDRGRPAEAMGSAEGRRSVTVPHSGPPVAAIEYDDVLIDEPELVATAGRILALALEREQLTAALLASEQEVRRSRIRIVEAGDLARDRIAQNLHDGLQGDLVLLGIQAQAIADMPTAAADVVAAATALRKHTDHASDDLRALVHSVMPPALAQQGLISALDDLADRVPVPTSVTGQVPPHLPAYVKATAYFIAAEAITNAVKHAQARRVDVRVDGTAELLTIRVQDDGVGGATDSGAGMGMPGMRDRADALGGRLTVRSPTGRGTELVVELPCG